MQLPFVGRITFWKVLFSILVLLGLYVFYVRFFQGIGYATNLSDQFPWGLWIGFDVLIGVGLAAGGFVIAATVHIFGIEKYEPIARPTILTAFLGYLLVCVALVFDLGQPWRIWHPLIMWNPHSVMFEVGWCVMLYTTVLSLEFSPAVFEKFGWKIPLKFIRLIYIPLVILGVLLSTMHQSSLGTLYVIAPDKLHPLWYSSLMPVFFFNSAIAAGLAMTIFESYMSYRAFGRRLESHLLRGLARVAVVVLSVYATMRLFDIVQRGAFPLIFTISQESVLFWGEFGLGVILPIILFAMPKVRHNQHGLFFAAMLTITGFVINRLNVAITGMQASSGTVYFPSWMELTITAAIVAAGFVAFALAVKYLNIFPEEEEGHVDTAEDIRLKHGPAFGGNVLIGLWALLIVGAALVAFSAPPAPATAIADDGTPIQAMASAEFDLPEDYTFPQAESSPGAVTFSHASHIDYEKANCNACHTTLFSLTKKGTPLTGALSEERIHKGDLCFSCHNGETSFGVEDDCSACHQ